MDEDKITIDKTLYNELMRDSRWLSALDAAGVDDWDGIDFAHELFEKWEEAIANECFYLVALFGPSCTTFPYPICSTEQGCSDLSGYQGS